MAAYELQSTDVDSAVNGDAVTFKNEPSPVDLSPARADISVRGPLLTRLRRS
jgi:hypothetical protein